MRSQDYLALPHGRADSVSAYGTLWEPNVLGGYTAAGAIAWAYLGRRFFKRPWLGIAFCIGGAAASLTRAAWLAITAVAAIGLLLPVSRRRLDLANLWLGSVAGLVLAAAILAADRLGKYTVPLARVPTSGTGSAPPAAHGFLSAVLNGVDLAGRWNQLGVVWDDIRNNLILGRGTAAFEALHHFQGVPQHLATLPLFILDSTGVLGLAVFVAFGIAVAARAWQNRSDDIALALGQVGLVVAITNLSTETMELMVGWFLVGLLLAAIDVAEKKRAAAAATE